MSKPMSVLKMIVACLVFSAATPVLAQPAIEATLKSDTPGPVISRYIYGQFSEHLGAGVYGGIWVGPDSSIPNVRGIRSDVVKALKAIKVPVIRWPGGCFADEYHWRDGIGPRDKRPTRENNWWGGAPETNAFGTHEYFDFIDQVGADAYLSVNVGSSTPTEMSQWMEYLTSSHNTTLANERRANGHDKPFKVGFVGIGNESWGCGGSMTADYYANELRRFGSFFHKDGTDFHSGNENTALRVASGANNFDTNWTRTVISQAGNYLDAISLHYYTLQTGNWTERKQGKATGFGADDWNAIFYQTSRMDDVLNQHIAVMNEVDPAKRVALYVDEWGTWYDVEPGHDEGSLYQQNTLRDGIVAAVNFNIFHKHADRVKMSNIAQTINVLQSLILTDGGKMALTPTYFAYQMYMPFQDSVDLPVEVTAPSLSSGTNSFPAFNMSAARGTDGKVYVAVANMDLKNGYVIHLDLGSLKVRQVSGQVLTSDKMDAHNTPGVAEEIHPAAYTGGTVSGHGVTLSVPAKSVVVVKLD